MMLKLVEVEGLVVRLDGELDRSTRSPSSVTRSTASEVRGSARYQCEWISRTTVLGGYERIVANVLPSGPTVSLLSLESVFEFEYRRGRRHNKRLLGRPGLS